MGHETSTKRLLKQMDVFVLPHSVCFTYKMINGMLDIYTKCFYFLKSNLVKRPILEEICGKLLRGCIFLISIYLLKFYCNIF